MKVALICFSLTGQQTGERLYRGLEAAGLTAELDKKVISSGFHSDQHLCMGRREIF